MTLIKREDALNLAYKGYIISTQDNVLARDLINELPSAELPKGELISRADALKTVNNMYDVCDTNDMADYRDLLVECFKVLPSVSADRPTSSDLISRADAIESMAIAIWHYPNELYADLNDYNMAEALAKDGLMSVTSQNLTKPNKAERIAFEYEKFPFLRISYFFKKP